MKKFLKCFLVCIFAIFLTSCSKEKKINLPKEVNRLSSVYYFGEDVYGVNVAPIYKNDYTQSDYKLINSNGELLLKEDIVHLNKECNFLNDGSISILNKKYNSKLIDKNGKILDDRYDVYSYLGNGVYCVSKDSKTGYCNSKGEDIVPPTDLQSVFNIKKGDKFPYKNDEGKIGFIDKTGKTVIPFKYDRFGQYSEKGNCISVCMDKKWGVIDKTGKIIIPFQFEYIFHCEDDNFIGELNGKTGLINRNGKVIIPFKYNFITEIKKGIYRILVEDKLKNNNLSGVVDNKGNIIVEPFESFKINYMDDKNIVCRTVDDIGNPIEYNKMLYQLLDSKQTTLTKDFYDEIIYYKDDLFRVKKDKKYGFVNRKGEIIIPIKFNNFLEINNNLCVVNLNGKYGIIDKTGHYKINPKYENIKYLNKDYYGVKLDNKWGIINTTNKIIKPIEYDDICRIDSKINCDFNVLLKKGSNGLLIKIN